MMLGPIEIEVIRNALNAAAAEMDVTIWRTSRSTIVRELLDYSTAVFDAEGRNLAQSARIPGHLNSMTHALRTLLADYSQTSPEAMQFLAERYLANGDAFRLAIIPEGQSLAEAPPAGKGTNAARAVTTGR